VIDVLVGVAMARVRKLRVVVRYRQPREFWWGMGCWLPADWSESRVLWETGFRQPNEAWAYWARYRGRWVWAIEPAEAEEGE
jgi:hypothetical protein